MLHQMTSLTTLQILTTRGDRTQPTLLSNLVLGPLLIGLMLLLGCQRLPTAGTLGQLNSRYSEQQPALSGDGRYLAFLSNRRGRQELVLFDLQQNQPVSLPPLNRRGRLIESPSLSRSGRYLVYLVNERGRPHIELYDRQRQRRQILMLGTRSAIRHPSISTEGRYVAFEQSHNGQWDIQVLDRGPGIEPDILQRSPERSVTEPTGAL